MAASAERVEGLTGSAAAAELLESVSEVTLLWLRERVLDGPVLKNEKKLMSYLRAAQAHCPSEQLRVLFLNARNRLLRDEVLASGTLDEVPMWPREVLRRALELNAAGIILVHNHPSGDPAPSGSDIQMTRRLQSAGRELGICLHDHLVLSAAGHSSMRALGLI